MAEGEQFRVRLVPLSVGAFRATCLVAEGVHTLLAEGEQFHVRVFLLSVNGFRATRLWKESILALLTEGKQFHVPLFLFSRNEERSYFLGCEGTISCSCPSSFSLGFSCNWFFLLAC